jgi:hypothetical protein
MEELKLREEKIREQEAAKAAAQAAKAAQFPPSPQTTQTTSVTAQDISKFYLDQELEEQLTNFGQSVQQAQVEEEWSLEKAAAYQAAQAQSREILRKRHQRILEAEKQVRVAREPKKSANGVFR